MDLDKLSCFLLGIPDTNDHKRILGVPKNRHDVIAIDTALRRRVAQLYSHPNGRTKEASEVKEYLEGIARSLKATAVKESAPQHDEPDLTPLDQSILAVLISQGGWNRQSRARLVAVAASYEITVGGLMRILEALGESARSGEGPLSKKGRSTTKLSRQWTEVPKSPSSLVDEFISKTAKKIAPEFNSSSPVMTLKIAVLFGLLTILAFVLSLRVLLAPDTPQPIADTLESDRNSNLFADNEVQEILIKPYESYPQLSFDEHEDNSFEYSDRLLAEVSTLQKLRDAIELSLLRGESPKEEWSQSLDVFLQLSTKGWFYASPQTRNLLLDELIGVFIETERDASLTELLTTFLIPNELILDEPTSINQFVLKAELIAGMRCSQRLTPRLRAALTSIQDPTITSCDMDVARADALKLSAKQLISLTEIEPRTVDLWQSWLLLSQSIVNEHQQFDTYAFAMQSIFDSTIDLTRMSRTRDLLGTLTKNVQWDDSLYTKEFIKSIYNENQYAKNKLWAIGYLITDTGDLPWLNSLLIIQPNKSINLQKLSQNIDDIWPEQEEKEQVQTYLSIPAGYQPELTSNWVHLYSKVKTKNDDAMTFLSLRRLNEAASAIWQGRPGIAQRVLTSIDEMNLDVVEISQTFPSEPEGWWRDRFYEAKNDIGLRLELIDLLVGIDATDLRPEDAERLASAAVSNPSNKIRRTATKVIIEQFPHGKNVAIAILNQLHTSRANHEIASLVSNLTEVVLPSMTDSTWALQARKALLQHAIALQSRTALNLDTIAYELAQSVSTELLFVSPMTQPPSGDVNPVDALKMLIQVRHRLLQDMYEIDSQFTFTPSGVLQEYIQLQLRYLELLKLEELQWRSLNIHQLSMPDLTLIEQASDVRRQLILCENAIATHWRSILTEIDAIYQKRTQ